MFKERASKRLRSSPSATPNEAYNSYLDTLPDDIVRIVLRDLSRRPQDENWHANVSAKSVNIALDVGGTLARVVRKEFRIIGGKHGLWLDPTLDESILRSLAYQLPLCKLVLQLPGRDVWICTPKGIIGESRGVDLLSRLLPGCGAELKEMVLHGGKIVVTENDILAISTHCTQLSSLAIHGKRIEGVLAPIWRSLGSTLTRIYVGCYYSMFGEKDPNVISAGDLVKHCVNLHRVDVEELDDGTTDVMVTLGSRIRVLGVESRPYMDLAYWRKVYDSCTNLEAVHFVLDVYGVPVVGLLSVSRTKLVSLTLSCLFNVMSYDEEFFSGLSACTALKKFELGVHSFDVAALRKLFESLKEMKILTCVIDLSDYGFHPKKDSVDALACNLRHVKSLTISTHTPLRGEEVSGLVGLPHLKFVTLRREPSFSKWMSRIQEVYAAEVVKTLKDCGQLVQLEISAMIKNEDPYRPLDEAPVMCDRKDFDDNNIKNRSHLIAEAAVMYGRKDFDMFIDGVQYRTW